jgi:hypothetical protein
LAKGAEELREGWAEERHDRERHGWMRCVGEEETMGEKGRKNK